MACSTTHSPLDATVLSGWGAHLPGLVDHVQSARLEAACHLAARVDGIALHGALGPAPSTPQHQLAQLQAGFGGRSSTRNVMTRRSAGGIPGGGVQ
jgi:hypothetical protein